MGMDGIKIDRITKSFLVDQRELQVLKDITLTIPDHKITVLLGKSGCGKTTLLRIVGGLDEPDSGSVCFEKKHRTAYVFQEPRLMPWLNVRDNITFGVPKEEMDPDKITQIIQTVKLSGFEKAKPSQLSGGMAQRCAIARALAYEPTFILMDEPFAALDHFTREEMQQELLRIHQEQKSSILFVTHSIDEALVLGDKIDIMENGKIKTEREISLSRTEREPMNSAFIELKKELIQSLFFDEAEVQI